MDAGDEAWVCQKGNNVWLRHTVHDYDYITDTRVRVVRFKLEDPKAGYETLSELERERCNNADIVTEGQGETVESD